MSLDLILAPGPGREDPVLWGLVTEDGTLQASGRVTPGHEVSDTDNGWAAAERVIVVVPGTDVTLHRVSLPARTEAQARAALPFALEDEVAGDVDGLHMALGPAGNGQARLAAVVSRACMDDWRGRLIDLGLEADIMVPDYLAVPAPNDEAQTLEFGGRTVVTLGPRAGFAVESDLLPAVLGPAMEREGLAGSRNLTLDDGAFLLAVHARLRDGAPLNLLQGSFGPRRRWHFDFAFWRNAAALLAMVLVGYGVLLGSEGWRMERNADALHARAEALFRETFPEVRRVVNPAAQMRSGLNGLRSASSDHFLRLATVLFRSLQSADQARLEALRFDQARGELVADVSYGSYRDMETIKAAVERQNARLEEGAARQMDGRTMGEIMVRLP